MTTASRTPSSQAVSRSSSKGKAPQRLSGATELNVRTSSSDESHAVVGGPQFSDDVVFAVCSIAHYVNEHLI